MADNKTHSWSASKSSSKSTADGAWLSHSFTVINTSAASKIPPYSQINSATASVSATKDPTGSLKVGTLEITLSDKENGASTSSITIAEAGAVNYKQTESASGSILSYVKSKTSNAGYIECSGKSYVNVEPYFMAAYSQQFHTTLTITWNYNEPRAIVTVSGGSGGGTYAYESSIKLTANSKTGYTHSGWSCSNGKTYTVSQMSQGLPVKDVITAYETSLTFTPTYTENKYTIAFNGNGNTGGSMSSLTNVGYDDSKTLTANAFTKTGYTFNGWNTKADGSGTSYADKASVSKLSATNGATVTLYAKWKANSYTIKFNANGGSGSMSDLAMTYGTAKNLTANSFTRTGYDFLGWSTSNTATTATYADKASVKNLVTSGTVTLYAVWKVKTYTITVKSNNDSYGTVSGGGTYNHGATATLTATPASGYKFVKWSDEVTTASRTVTVTGNVTYTAVFEKIKYDVTFKNYDGTVLQTSTVEHGGTPNYTGSTPTKSSTAEYSYSFSGWNPSIGAITSDTTYIAQFTATKRKYTISTSVTNGVISGGGTYEYGASITLIASPADGYKFEKWSDGNTQNPRVITVTGNVTYEAQFRRLVLKFKTVKIYYPSENDIASPTNPLISGEKAQMIVQVALE